MRWWSRFPSLRRWNGRGCARWDAAGGWLLFSMGMIRGPPDPPSPLSTTAICYAFDGQAIYANLGLWEPKCPNGHDAHGSSWHVFYLLSVSLLREGESGWKVTEIYSWWHYLPVVKARNFHQRHWSQRIENLCNTMECTNFLNFLNLKNMLPRVYEVSSKNYKLVILTILPIKLVRCSSSGFSMRYGDTGRGKKGAKNGQEDERERERERERKR